MEKTRYKVFGADHVIEGKAYLVREIGEDGRFVQEYNGYFYDRKFIWKLYPRYNVLSENEYMSRGVISVAPGYIKRV